jgi:hypothetical protein
VEATPLSAHDETETQTPVSVEGNINWTGPGIDIPSMSAGGHEGAPLSG